MICKQGSPLIKGVTDCVLSPVLLLGCYLSVFLQDLYTGMTKIGGALQGLFKVERTRVLQTTHTWNLQTLDFGDAANNQ